ncbi:MAG TPA: UvrD-helicase domain-containing protein, partial [Solirubrobacteraceae bacterium]|nr:UvrD-helicase domain-containing protein [Solirubrobacteraceae bacterium]
AGHVRLQGRLSVPDDLPVRALSARRASSQLETLPGMESAGVLALAGGEVRALTEEQQDAVARRSESLLVSAAAGSGKTSVLVERFVAAVRDDGLAPGRILAITFTERAAGELRERVRDRLLELGDRQAARDTEAAFVGTFHGFCARLLRAHPFAAGLDPDFAILDEGLAGRLREQAFAGALREFLAAGGTSELDILASYTVDRVRGMVEHVYLELRSRGQLLPRLPVAAPREDAGESDVEAAAACVLLDDLLARFALAYEQLKRSRASADFDDLELLAQQLLGEHESVREEWSQRFELLMVDEFQDTNPRQLAILRALDRENLFTVGDELQSIYGFRHADVGLFRARRDELARQNASLSLTSNFRSREALLDVVNEVFGQRFENFSDLRPGAREGEGDESAPEDDRDEPAVELLLTDMDGWQEREELAAAVGEGLPPAPLWRQAEARLLARRVAQLVGEGAARPGDVVVLLRASGDLEVFERALQLCGLRTLAAVGAFWGHQQIGDLVGYLRALANPLDELALYGLLASPLGGCSRDCLALIARAAQASRRGAWETAQAAASGEGELAERIAPVDREALARACALLERERAGMALRTIAASIERAIEATGYREHVLSLEWGERRLANVHKLLRLARRFEATEGRDLRGFLDRVEYLASGARVEPDAPVEGVEPDAVRLMTIHAAKGLEFPVVCVADLGRQPSSRMPDLLVDGDRIGVRLMRLDGESSQPALAYEELCAELRTREAEEEDRIAYVAMTRARERLLLSGSARFGRWPRLAPGAAPISWLAPALSPDLPQRLAGEPVEPGGASPTPDDPSRALPDGVLLRLNSPADPFASGPRAGAVDTPSSVPPPGAPSGSEPEPSVRESAPVASDTSAARDAEIEQLRALSYSSLTELERCGYRYYLERVLSLPEDRAVARAGDGAGLEARARGTLVHRLMELADFSDVRDASADEVERAGRELGMQVAAHEREELARLVSAARRAPLAARVAAAHAVRREHPFAFSLGAQEPLITGVIDLVASEADGSRLVLDYKSDRVEPGVDLDELVQRDYGVQRLLYGLAVLREGATEVEIVHWFLERGEWVGARYAAAERVVLEERIAERIATARERRFSVSERPHRGLCLTCPGRVGLCSWSESETLRELSPGERAGGGRDGSIERDTQAAREAGPDS